MTSLLHLSESKTLEFKRETSSPKNWLKTLFAFANSAGGRLVFGVADDRTIHGIAAPLDEEERICNQIADSIAPRRAPNIEFLTVFLKEEITVSGSVSGAQSPTQSNNYLHPAMEQGLIEYTLPDKPNSRLQKYRLTPKGQQLLEARK
jgi:predicted HTH transcriptional regulator